MKFVSVAMCANPGFSLSIPKQSHRPEHSDWIWVAKCDCLEQIAELKLIPSTVISQLKCPKFGGWLCVWMIWLQLTLIAQSSLKTLLLLLAIVCYLFHRINKFVSYFVYDKRYITELKIKCLAELFMLLNSKRKYKSVFRIKYKLNLWF